MFMCNEVEIVSNRLHDAITTSNGEKVKQCAVELMDKKILTKVQF